MQSLIHKYYSSFYCAKYLNIYGHAQKRVQTRSMEEQFWYLITPPPPPWKYLLSTEITAAAATQQHLWIQILRFSMEVNSKQWSLVTDKAGNML